MLINRSGTMVVPFLTLYMTSPAMGYSIGQAGLVFGCFGAGAFSGAYIGGRLTDRIGFYRVQLVTLLGGALLFWVLGQMKSLPFICSFTFLLSFVNEAFRPANSTAVAHYSSLENRTRSFSLNRLAINLGWALGSAVGGILAGISYKWLFWIDGCTNIFAALLMWFLLNKSGTAAQLSKLKTDAQLVATSKQNGSAYKDRNYLLFIGLVVLFAACFFQIFTNVSVYMRQVLHFKESFIGLLMATNGLVIVLFEMVIIHQLDGRNNHMAYISFGVGLVALFFLLLGVSPVSPLAAISLIILITFGEIMSMPFMNSYWISRSSERNRGEYAALYTMAWSAAQTLGPMLSAQLAEYAGFQFTWLIIASICLLVALSFWLYRGTFQ
ncbi:MFS transporter [Flavihumibacter fluvii]|uniref:MFS transporter n=1 Tax=Flavihumibacter fluvii TaxID=2838157 RepID=UPI001BDDD0BA|nr:MFS transporter [Flavihumibacter fluvii]ULQ53692.1 MFS transporter [Flavihumibacter fluvii]